MRRHVTPALPTATIPDPARGDALPREGRTVDWSPHWAGMTARGDVTVGDVIEPDPAEPVPEATPAEPDPSADAGDLASEA